MSRAARIVGIASSLVMAVTLTGIAPAGAASATITSIAAVTEHAGCSRMSNATVKCAGLNESGELGDGNTATSVAPVNVVNTAGSGPLTGVAQVSTGNFYACARLESGEVDCWGDNSYGQLGDGRVSSTPTVIPVTVLNSTGTGPLTGVAQIATGKYATCARLNSGGVDCWGHNGYYELGNGTNIQHLLPTPVLNGAGHGPITGQINISVSQYDACSVQSDGSVRCWGLNQYGVLGIASATSFEPLPTRVKAVSGTGFLANVTNVVTAPAHTCALLKNGTVDCWGLNAFGELGDGTTTTRMRPVVVKGVSGGGPLVHVTQVTVGGGSGGDHTCAKLAALTALCWGENTFGQLGNGGTANSLRPSIVRANVHNTPLTEVTSIVAGPIATCATIAGGSARCWGFNQGGQFGNGSAHNATRPVPSTP
jgi:alpha-tubulin suppressor-like RCC1 family protein